MKIIKYLSVGVFTLASIEILGQATQPSNIGFGPPFTQFLGFSNNYPLALRTNGFNRFKIEDGFGGPNAGRISIGNNLPNNFTPQSRVHIHQTNGFFGPSDSYIRFTNNLTGPTATDGFEIGNSSTLFAAQGDIEMRQFEFAPVKILAPNTNTNSPNTLPYEWFRLQNGASTGVGNAFRPSDGYIGLNEQAPRAHIEMKTPAFQGGEEFLMAKPTDVNFANVQQGMMNLTAVNNQFLPGYFGNLNHPSQNGPAFTTIGAISIPQDIPGNQPVTRFISARDWVINQNMPSGVDQFNPVINRKVFAWYNGAQVKMYMNATGRVRIENNAIITGNNPGNNSNNRLEITAAAIDPYFNPNGNPQGNPNFGNVNFGSSSGLRFTFLTSRDLVIAPNATNEIDPTKVLSVDRNGDVVAIRTIGAANNGLTVVNGTVQLGVACNSSIVAQANLLSDREVPLNGFDFVFSGATGSVGIGTGCNPANKLEVNNNTGPNFLSGLRLTDLAGATPTTANNQVLSVNAAGDVILTDAPAAGVGGFCTTTSVAVPLIADYEIPLNQNNYYFSGSQLTGDRVAVGYLCGAALPSKFNVELNQTYNTSFNIGNNAGYFRNINTGTAHNVGVKGEVTSGAGDNSGGFFVANSTGINSSNNGVYSRAAGSPNTNRGGFFQGIGGNDAVGITATAFGGLNSTYAGYFNGDVYVNGGANSGTGYLVASDQNYKTNIDSTINAKSILSQLKPRTYYFDTLNTAGIKFSSKKQYGLIAQHVETVLPELVGSVTKPAEKDSLGNIIIPSTTYKNLNYNAFIGILIKGLQEQQKTIDSLKTKVTNQDSINTSFQNQLNSIMAMLNACCSNSNARATGIQGNQPNAVSQLNIDLSDKDVIVLNQNVPNPFAEQTTITYNVPEKYGFAQLVFKTIDGKIIKTVDITKKGRGQVNVFANDLSNGLYMYSLVVDGVVVDTKKMVKQ